MICKNCNNEFEGRYCPHCGTEASIDKNIEVISDEVLNKSQRNKKHIVILSIIMISILLISSVLIFLFNTGSKIGYVKKEINSITYSIPQTWADLENNSDDNTKYYYPENAMLMVSYDEAQEFDITNKETRNEYIQGMMSALEIKEYDIESSIVNELEAIIVKGDIMIDGIVFNTRIIIFATNNAIYTFALGVNDDTAENYNEQFNKIISTIEISD